MIAGHKLDLPIERRLVVELKAVDQLINIHTAQVLSYLKAMDSHLGLLINFNVPLLKNGIRRVVRTTDPRRRGVVAVQS